MVLEYPNFGKHLFNPELELQQEARSPFCLCNSSCQLQTMELCLNFIPKPFTFASGCAQEQMHDLLLPKGRSISTGYDFDGHGMPCEARDSLPF